MTIARRVNRRSERLQAALEGKAATDVELLAAHALSRSLRRISAPVARELGLDPKTVQDWGNVESGDRGPHLVLALLTELALEMRPRAEDRAECFAALDFVESYLGRTVVDLDAQETDDRPAGRLRHLAALVLQLAEFVQAASADPSAATYARAHRELTDVIAAGNAILADLRAASGLPEAQIPVLPLRGRGAVRRRT